MEANVSISAGHEYEKGFGSVDAEHWAGLQTIHALTTNGNKILRIELQDLNGNVDYAEYSTFVVGSKATNYKIKISGYSGNIGDSLVYGGYLQTNINGMMFTTKDRDNDKSSLNCATIHGGGGGWWFNSCQYANLNGDYTSAPNTMEGIVWRSWYSVWRSMKKSTMMIQTRG